MKPVDFITSQGYMWNWEIFYDLRIESIQLPIDSYDFSSCQILLETRCNIIEPVESLRIPINDCIRVSESVFSIPIEMQFFHNVVYVGLSLINQNKTACQTESVSTVFFEATPCDFTVHFDGIPNYHGF